MNSTLGSVVPLAMFLAINQVFWSILRGVRILLTHCNRNVHTIWHHVIMSQVWPIFENMQPLSRGANFSLKHGVGGIPIFQMDAVISPLPSNSFPIWFQFSWITNVVFFCGGIIVNLVEVRWQLHSPPDPLLFWSITSDKGGGGGFPGIAWKGLQLKRQGDISNAFDMLSYHCHPFIIPNQILLIQVWHI